MHECRLQHPSSFYAAQFRPEELKITPAHSAGPHQWINGAYEPADSSCPIPVMWLRKEREEASIELGQSEVDRFTLRLPSTGGSVAPEFIELAMKVLATIFEMDSEARQLWDDSSDNYEESLSDVCILHDTILFTYLAGAWNTSWKVYFDINGDGTFGPAEGCY